MFFLPYDAILLTSIRITILLTHSVVCDDVFHLHIVYLLQVAPDVIFGHLRRHLERYHIRGHGFLRFDELHEEVW